MTKETTMITGRAAIDSGEPLFVRGLDGKWIPALPGTRERANRMSGRALWIYGVRHAGKEGR